MTVLDLLTSLRRKGVELELTDDRLVSRSARGVLTPELDATVRAHRAEIISFLRDGMRERPGASPAPPIGPAPRSELMPLSFTQERLWYLSQVEANPAVFNAPMCLRMRGALCVPTLRRCLNEIVSRHEALRTTITVQDGAGFQRIHEPCGLALAEFDVEGVDPEASRTAALALLDREASAPLDLASRPAVQATLVRSAADDHYLLVVTHHVFTDGASITIFLDELVALYEAFVESRPSPLPRPALQFADYAAWQREWLRGPALEQQLAFWKERLAGDLPVLNLPTDHPRPAVRGSSGAKEALRMPRATVESLAAVARAEGATTYMALVALFNVLLHRHTGQEDLIIGTPVANRTRRESESIFGYIANTLVLRTDCGGAPTFRELVRRVRDGCAGAFRHQDMPFQKIVEALQPPRELSRTPIFQAFFTYEEVFTEPATMADLQLSRVIVGSTVSRQDISMFLRQVSGEVLGSLEFSTDLFTRESMVRLIAHFVRLGESAAAHPDLPIADLDMLTDAEVRVLRVMHGPESGIPDALVHEEIETQAAIHPDRVALRAAGVELTYRELDRRANQIANALRARGVGANDIVAVLLDRSVEMVVALLGILKSGASYLPLDPEFPAKRLSYILSDARARIVLTRPSPLARVGPVEPQVLCVDEAEVLSAPEAAVPRTATPESIAYVIYTSGSTGAPKGVEVSHRSVVNLLTSMRKRPGIGEDDVLVAVTTVSFDIAALELLLPLTAGARVVVAARDVAADGGRLAELMRTEDATMLQATPATWRLLLDSGWKGQRNLRALCGGEALSAQLAARLIPLVGELWNMYGPTETTIWSTCARLTEVNGPVTIGRPIDNTILRILGPGGDQVPVGVPGELYIGGAGVARGYLGRPELTAERFVDDPARDSVSGARFYRTGDLVRMRVDGDIEFVGRIDTQVKVQGYRIELGEIESELMRLDEISEAAVTVSNAGDGAGRLVANVVILHGCQMTSTEIRRRLRERLPSFMIPGLVVELDALPRLPNGKVDRNALLDPLAGGVPARGFVAPATSMERIVAEAWEALLPGQRAGRGDNFFELGGHSILSMRAVAAIEDRTGIRMDPRLMFFQTVAQLAASLEAAAGAGSP